MQYILEGILIITAFVSLIPVVNMFRNKEDNKYVCLKFLIYSSFVWTILVLLERISTSTFLIYYSHMLGYPLKLLFATLMLCTIFQYVEKKLPKGLILVLGFLIVVDFLIAITNSNTLWFLNLKYSELASFNDFFTANTGLLFIYHLLISYAVALAGIVFLFIFLAKQRGIRQYKEVTHMLVLSVLIVLLFNLLQLIVVKINIDLTYVSLVFVAFILYRVIYSKDMVFNLRASGRGEILSNMREMYILTDSERRIIEISSLLIEKYHLSSEEVISKPFDDLVKLLEDRVVLYSEYNVNEAEDNDKDHYHLREKEFKLKGMNDYGHMILLYDETQVYELLRELNKLSNYDTMTGLNNRNYIEQKLDKFNDTKNIGILSLDLNGLKINNDYLGHERGDYLLKTMATKMKLIFEEVKPKDIARIGGDEFIIIVYDTTAEEIGKKKAELLKLCEHKDIEQKISVSIGVAFGDTGDNSIYHLIQKADAEMYEMKSQTSKKYQEEMIEYIKLQDKFIR